MAAGTVVSRMSGFVRNALLAAALGQQLHADVFTIANTVPNMLYILLAGGVFNAVLVPQLVRAMKNDADGGDGYTNRIITLAALFLAGVTAILVIAAPLLMRLFLSDAFFTPELAPQRESVIDFARYCLPQVFFYGMFVLVGQVLNARRSFGPMMWAPIANNVISVAVLGGLPAHLRPGAQPVPGRGRRPGGAVRPGLDRRRLHQRPGAAARPRLDPRHRRAAADPGAVPQAGRLHLPPPLRLPRHRAGAHAASRRVDRAVRGGEPGRLHGRGEDRLLRYGGRGGECLRAGRRRSRHRLHDLLPGVPAGDGAALHRHGLARDGDAAAARRLRRRRATCAASAGRWARRCGRRTP